MTSWSSGEVTEPLTEKTMDRIPAKKKVFEPKKIMSHRLGYSKNEIHKSS